MNEQTNLPAFGTVTDPTKVSVVVYRNGQMMHAPFPAESGVVQDHIASTDADARLSITGTAGSAVLAFNDKADGTGTNAMTLTETGAFTVSGSVTLPAGSVYVTNSVIGTGASVFLATGTAGSIIFRPNGIGSTTGQATLDSAGTFNADSIYSSGGAGYVGTRNVESSSILIMAASASSMYLRPNGYTNATGEATLTTGGMFTAPNLTSSGNFTLSNGIITAAGGSILGYSNNATIQLFNWRGSDKALISTGTAAYKVGAGQWADSSDSRIKTVLADYVPGLPAVKGLRPIVYSFLGNDTYEVPPEGETAPYSNSIHHDAAVAGTTFVGFVAQEVETVMPRMVKKAEGYINGRPVTDLRELDVSNLIFTLVNAVKELAARVETLEAKVP